MPCAPPGRAGFRAALRMHLVETSPLCARARTRRSRAIAVAWHEQLRRACRDGPMLLRRQRILRCAADPPIRCATAGLARARGRPRATASSLPSAGRAGPERLPLPAPMRRDRRRWSRSRPAAIAIAGAIGAPLAAAPGAALIIDYGHAAAACGDTLQAVRRHQPARPAGERRARPTSPPMSISPAWPRAAPGGGAEVLRPDTQGEFLRASASSRAPTSDRQGRRGQARDDRTARTALDRPGGEMGNLFKVAGARTRRACRRRPVSDRHDRQLATALAEIDGIRHGFFTRAGRRQRRASIASLNCGFGSGDDRPTRGREPRARLRSARRRARRARHRLSGAQHRRRRRSSGPGTRGSAPQADAMVTARAGRGARHPHRRLRAGAVRRSAGAA